MREYKYHLQKWHGISSRHECPNCHDKTSFVLYVDDNENPLSVICGKCNHESSCGYHYTPHQYKQDHIDERDGWERRERELLYMPKPTPKPKPLCFIPSEYVTMSHTENNYLIQFLYNGTTFSHDAIHNVYELYKIGSTNTFETIFWQIDKNEHVRSGKIIPYNFGNGHRKKDVANKASWTHSRLKYKHLLPDTWELTQCLFGEHLLSLPGNAQKEIALVESEKTALVGSLAMPEFLWLACGGKGNLNFDKCKVLEGRTIHVFPDVDGMSVWKAKVETLKPLIHAKFIFKTAWLEFVKEGQTDIADIILDNECLIIEKQLREKYGNLETDTRL